jgi:nitroreductase
MTTETSTQTPVAGMDVLAAIYTTRAMRRLKPDPIPGDVLRKIMDAAIRAPSGGNTQGWSFVVVTDPELRAGLAGIYKPCIGSLAEPRSPYYAALHSEDDAIRIPTEKMMKSVLYLGNHMQEAPAVVVPCLRTGGRPTSIGTGSSIFPAVQNLMVAARAFGVGSTLTTIANAMRGQEIKDLLGVPAEIETVALIPLGYPMGRWGVAPRRPMAEVVYGDRYGQAFG